MGMSPIPMRAAPQGVTSPQGLLSRPATADAQSAPDATQNDASKAFMTQVRRLHSLLDDLARVSPEGAPLIRKMKEMATELMVKYVSTERGREQPTPNLPG